MVTVRLMPQSNLQNKYYYFFKGIPTTASTNTLGLKVALRSKTDSHNLVTIPISTVCTYKRPVSDTEQSSVKIADFNQYIYIMMN